jgi:AcrR family transcriptional regulator
MTVYNHFPTELEMIDACSSHWVAQNPPPDPARWRDIEDPDQRTRHALERLYGYYRRNAEMVGNFLRDAPLVPALGQILDEKWFPMIGEMAERLLDGRALVGESEARTRAAANLVLAFGTWRTFAEGGLEDADAARLAAAMLTTAAEPADPADG